MQLLILNSIRFVTELGNICLWGWDSRNEKEPKKPLGLVLLHWPEAAACAHGRRCEAASSTLWWPGWKPTPPAAQWSSAVAPLGGKWPGSRGAYAPSRPSLWGSSFPPAGVENESQLSHLNTCLFNWFDGGNISISCDLPYHNIQSPNAPRPHKNTRASHCWGGGEKRSCLLIKTLTLHINTKTTAWGRQVTWGCCCLFVYKFPSSTLYPAAAELCVCVHTDVGRKLQQSVKAHLSGVTLDEYPPKTGPPLSRARFNWKRGHLDFVFQLVSSGWAGNWIPCSSSSAMKQITLQQMPG